MDENKFVGVKTAKMLFSERYDNIYFHMIVVIFLLLLFFFLAINSKIPKGANENVSGTLL